MNPTSDYVILFKDEIPLDSSRLDENNRFSFELENLTEGLYHFEHTPEYQYIYLSKGDSIVLRLNTQDFDESLVFDGLGSKINNFLLEMFLSNEAEEHFVNASYKLDVAPFTKRIDSLRKPKIKRFNEFIELNEDLSPDAKSVALASIEYPSFLFLEKYPYKHKKYTGNSVWNDLPDSYFKYRKNLEYNDHNLTYFKPYHDFMKDYIDNLSYAHCLKDCNGDANFKYEHYHFNKHKLGLIDSLMIDPHLRNNLFRSVALHYYINSKGIDKNSKAFLNQFEQLTKNEEHIAEVKRLYQSIEKLKPGNELPDLLVVNANQEEVTIADIADEKDVVFYFWTAAQPRHIINLNKKIENLRTSHPDFTFVGISLRTDAEQWDKIVKAYNLDTDYNYRTKDYYQASNTLVINKLEKGIVVRDGRIDNAFVDINNPFK